MANFVRYQERIPAGASWSARLRRGQALQLVDPEGFANASCLFHRADDPLERFNLPDTLKAQLVSFVGAPYVLYSDMGHVMASVVRDDLGWHDVLCGATDPGSVEAKYGPGDYQDLRNARRTNARDHFLVELGKYGLGERDLVPPVNFFSKVVPDANGFLSFVPGHSHPGAQVSLRMEMDVLVTISATPHAMDPALAWNPKPIDISVFRMHEPGPDDSSRSVCEQNRRGFELTERLYL